MTDHEVKIAKFTDQPMALKIRTLAMADAFGEQKKREDEILDCMYQKGKNHRLISIMGDIAVLENHINPSFQHATFTVCVVIRLNDFSKWQHTSTYFSSIEAAYLGGLSRKYEGMTGQFAHYATRMLGIPE